MVCVTALCQIPVQLDNAALAAALMQTVLERYLQPTFDDAGCDWWTDAKCNVYVGADWLVIPHNEAASSLIDAYNTLKYGVPRHC